MTGSSPRHGRRTVVRSDRHRGRRVRGQGSCEAEPNHTDRHRAVSRGPRAELTVLIVTPTFGGAVGYRAPVIPSDGDGRHVRAEPGDVNGRLPVVRGAVTHLTVAVPSPALCSAARRERARGTGGCHNRGGTRAEAGDANGRLPVDRGAVAQLAVAVVAPALQRCAGGERAGVIATTADRGDTRAEAADVHRHVRSVGRAVADPTAVPPALHCAARRERARVVAGRQTNDV